MGSKIDLGLEEQFLKDIINAKVRAIVAQREKIVEAFIAETGLKPSECEQVIEKDGIVTRWYIRKRS